MRAWNPRYTPGFPKTCSLHLIRNLAFLRLRCGRRPARPAGVFRRDGAPARRTVPELHRRQSPQLLHGMEPCVRMLTQMPRHHRPSSFKTGKRSTCPIADSLRPRGRSRGRTGIWAPRAAAIASRRPGTGRASAAQRRASTHSGCDSLYLPYGRSPLSRRTARYTPTLDRAWSPTSEHARNACNARLFASAYAAATDLRDRSSVSADTVLLHCGQCQSSTGGSRPSRCTEWNRAPSCVHVCLGAIPTPPTTQLNPSRGTTRQKPPRKGAERAFPWPVAIRLLSVPSPRFLL